MSKTFNAKQLQDLIKILFDSYMKLPAKTGRNFSNYYICIECTKIADIKICDCSKSSTKKKPRKKRKSKKKQPGIPKAIRMKPIL